MEGIELVAFSIISNAGDASAQFLTAIQKAEEGKYSDAKTCISEGADALKQAHLTQTKLIQAEINGQKQELNLLIVHAQDHLMNAVVLKSVVTTIVNLYEKVGAV
ncbi:MAG: PTS lactose/cellobiose transporter subunit IIA [Culicoidibacterales bacterium]